MVLIISNRAIAIAVGQSILVTTLSQELPKLTPAIPAEVVIKAGASNLSKITNSSTALALLRIAYDRAIHNVLIYSLAAICTALPFALGMQWLNVKKAAQKVSESQVAVLGEGEEAKTS